MNSISPDTLAWCVTAVVIVLIVTAGAGIVTVYALARYGAILRDLIK